MPSFKFVVTWKPTGEVEEFGPWPILEDEGRALLNLSFSHGLVTGIYTERYKVDNAAENLDIAVHDIPDNHVVGTLVAEASAMVTHADGTVG
jgi:hypothetical protein